MKRKTIPGREDPKPMVKALKKELINRIQSSRRLYNMLYGRPHRGLASAFSRRNQKKNRMLAERLGLEKDAFLTGQGHSPADGLKFGASNFGRSGCEVMACYNALKYMKKDAEITELIRWFESAGASGAGFIGTSPRAIERRLRKHGLDAKLVSTEDPAQCDELLKHADCGILTFWWGRGSLIIHTVFLAPCENGLKAYNFSGCEDFTLLPSVESVSTARGIIPISIIVINDKGKEI